MESWLICYSLMSAVVFLCIFCVWKRRQFYILSAQLPGPLAFPLIGNGFSFLCKPEELLDRVLKLTMPYASPMRLWLGPHLAIVVHDPDQLQVIMQSQKLATKSFIYQFLEPFMGKGLFTSSGVKHKTERKLLQPLFAPKVLEEYSYLFQKHANRFIEVLKPYIDRDEFDVLPLLHDSAFEATMDILIEDKNEHSVDYKQIPEFVRRFYYIFSKRVASFWLYPECLYKLTTYYREQNAMYKVVTALTDEIRDVRIPELEKKLEFRSDANENEELRTPSMLELMYQIFCEKPGCLSEQDFKDHILTFVATSQDTQSSTIAFTLMMLGMYQDIQTKVVEELKEIIGDKHCIGYGDIGRLKYMEMCIKESMRLFPLGPFLLRDVLEDFQLGKWMLPAGSSVILSVYQVHRNPNYWENPDEFYPEHFTPEAVLKRHPFAYLPFSAGPRRCIAQQYSYVNMKILIGTILQNYSIECRGTLKNLKLITDVSIRPLHGYNISLIRREKI